MTRLAIIAWCVGAIICLAPGAYAAKGPGGTVDISKLKQGDKLEVQVGSDWVPAEYIETISDQMVRVKRADFPQPVGAIVAFIRLPQGRAKAKSQAKQADNPFATAEEKAAVGALRTWTDRDGKFTVEARLLKVENDKVVLRRADDKEINVALEKLTEADQKYAADFKAGKVEVEAADKSKERDLNDPTEPDIAITRTNLDNAPVIEVAAGTAWKYQPDVAPRGEASLAQRVSLPPKEFFENPTGLMFLPAEKKAFVVFVNSPPGFKAPVTRVHACDLSHGKVESGVFGADVTPIDISSDGSMVLAHSGSGWGTGSGTELRIYSREGKKVKPLVAWVPYRHHPWTAAVASSAARVPKLGPDGDISWAAFVDTKHVITLNPAGELALWKIPKLEPVYVLKCQRQSVPTWSSGRRYLAVAADAGVAIVNVLSGEVAGVVETEMGGNHWSSVALRGDGTRLALRQYGRLRVWDLTNRDMTRDFALDGGPANQLPSAWTDDDHLLVDGIHLVDVERRITLCQYMKLGAAWQVRDGRLWFVGPGLGTAGPVLTSIALPQKGLADPAPGMTADQLLVIRPGMEVAIELPGGANSPDDKATLEKITKRLNENGMTVVPQSKVKLVGTIEAGRSQTVEYRAFGAPHRSAPVATSQVTEQVLRLKYVVDGATVWEFRSHSGGAPSIVRPERGETADQAVQRSVQQSTRVDGKAFGNIWIPSHVAHLPNGVKPIVSTTPEG